MENPRILRDVLDSFISPEIPAGSIDSVDDASPVYSNHYTDNHATLGDENRNDATFTESTALAPPSDSDSIETGEVNHLDDGSFLRTQYSSFNDILEMSMNMNFVAPSLLRLSFFDRRELSRGSLSEKDDEEATSNLELSTPRSVKNDRQHEKNPERNSDLSTPRANQVKRDSDFSHFSFQKAQKYDPFVSGELSLGIKAKRRERYTARHRAAAEKALCGEQSSIKLESEVSSETDTLESGYCTPDIEPPIDVLDPRSSIDTDDLDITPRPLPRVPRSTKSALDEYGEDFETKQIDTSITPIRPLKIRKSSSTKQHSNNSERNGLRVAGSYHEVPEIQDSLVPAPLNIRKTSTSEYGEPSTAAKYRPTIQRPYIEESDKEYESSDSNAGAPRPYHSKLPATMTSRLPAGMAIHRPARERQDLDSILCSASQQAQKARGIRVPARSFRGPLPSIPGDEPAMLFPRPRTHAEPYRGENSNLWFPVPVHHSDLPDNNMEGQRRSRLWDAVSRLSGDGGEQVRPALQSQIKEMIDALPAEDLPSIQNYLATAIKEKDRSAKGRVPVVKKLFAKLKSRLQLNIKVTKATTFEPHNATRQIEPSSSLVSPPHFSKPQQSSEEIPPIPSINASTSNRNSHMTDDYYDLGDETGLVDNDVTTNPWATGDLSGLQPRSLYPDRVSSLRYLRQ